MKEKDIFELSAGNQKVFETVPLMMLNEKYRKELRLLVLKFLTDKNA